MTEENTKEYFTAHKEQYIQHVRQPFEGLLTELAKEFGGTACVFRPNRDVRFSADKSPYKTNISGYLAGRFETMSATFVELSAGGLMAATGYYQMAPDQLEKYRTALLSEGGNIYGAELRSLFADVGRAGCTVGGELLKTAPRGVNRTAENIDLLRYKSVTVSATLRIEGGETLAQAETFVTKTWHAGQPVSNWLDQHVGASTLAP